jgi:hypothetical protein
MDVPYIKGTAYVGVNNLEYTRTTCRSTLFKMLYVFSPYTIDAMSKSEKSSGASIYSLIRRSILSLEIWLKRQYHNFEEVSLSLALFLFSYL